MTDSVFAGDGELAALMRATDWSRTRLGNAWKYTSRTAAPRIAFGRAHDGEQPFFVRDNGAGFDPDDADQLFQPFQRLHSEREFEGTGIGLATVQRIVARHGGQIWAESRIGAGATFYFTLAGPEAAALARGD